MIFIEICLAKFTIKMANHPDRRVGVLKSSPILWSDRFTMTFIIDVWTTAQRFVSSSIPLVIIVLDERPRCARGFYVDR